MKSVILFMLLGLSLFNEGQTTNINVNIQADTNDLTDCLKEALQNEQYLLETLGDLMCASETLRTGAFQDKMDEVLGAIGCKVNQISGADAKDASPRTWQAVRKIKTFLSDQSFNTNLLNAACHMKNPNVQKKCAQNIYQYIKKAKKTQGTLSSLQNLFCASNSEDMDVNQVSDLMEQVNCPLNIPLDDLGQSTDEVKNMFNKKIRNLVSKILKIPGTGPMLENVLCEGSKTVGNRVGSIGTGENLLVGNKLGRKLLGENLLGNVLGGNLLGNVLGGNLLGNVLGGNLFGNLLGGNLLGGLPV